MGEGCDGAGEGMLCHPQWCLSSAPWKGDLVKEPEESLELFLSRGLACWRFPPCSGQSHRWPLLAFRGHLPLFMGWQAQAQSWQQTA